MPDAEYFRRDRQDGVSPPNLAKTCTFAEHIVRARGKRTQYTSVALDPDRIRDFGDCLYRLECAKLRADQHVLVEHGELLQALRTVATTGMQADRARAIQALRYAKRRTEGLVDWKFDTTGVPANALVTWASKRIRVYFTKA